MPLPDSLLDEYGVDPRDIAVSLAVSRQLVLFWRRGIREVTPKHAKEIEAKFRIPKHLMRPDVWDPPEPKVARREKTTAST